jgi:DNA polymerase-4
MRKESAFAKPMADRAVSKVFACVRVPGLGVQIEEQRLSSHTPGAAAKPVVLCDEAGHRVVSASPAALKRGVRPGLSRWEAARRCPGLLVSQPDPEKYHYFWRRLLDICGDYTPHLTVLKDPTICPLPEPPQHSASCSGEAEILLDLTGTERLFGPPDQTAHEIRNRLRADAGLLASVGLGPNPLVARLACELANLGDVAEVAPDQAPQFVGRLPIAMLPGVDLQRAQQLGMMGLRQAKDLAALPPDAVARAFGEWGRRLWEMAQGRPSPPLNASPLATTGASPLATTGATQSEFDLVSAETDLHPATEDADRIHAALRATADQVARRLRRQGEVARQVSIELVFHDLRKVRARRTLRYSTRSPELLFHAARTLFQRMKLNGRLVRRVRLHTARLAPGPQGGQTALPLEDREPRRQRLAEMVERLRDRFGETAVTRGSVFAELHRD